MNVLIVVGNENLANLWAGHIARQGAKVDMALTEAEAIDRLTTQETDVIVLDLVLEGGSAFAVADFASYYRPDARVIFVTDTTFFSDGSIFRHIPNACAFLPRGTTPEDLAAVVDHYGVRHIPTEGIA